MTVSIVQDWSFPTDSETFDKKDSGNSLFYLAWLRKGRQRFLKVGTTARTIKARFSSKDYKEYSEIRLLYVAEITSDKAPKLASRHVEDLTRSAIREMKGFTFVPNDRFQFFQLPNEIPVYTSLDTHIMVKSR